MKAARLMIQGTGSSVGKSLITAALCRIFARRGISVAPFKPQNMSLNSFITAEGHEISRAQAVQAEAAGIEPSALMNPVLLKPSGERVSQVIVNGEVRAVMSAEEYYAFRGALKDEVRAAFNALAARHDLVLIEGAGSPAEINLAENDIANMGAADLCDAPVILAGDIERGGVFAALYGTVKLLDIPRQRRVKGFIINKFRGDMRILEPGLRQLAYLLARPVFGVLPYRRMHIDEEDSLSERPNGGFAGEAKAGKAAPELDVAIIRLPRLSGFTDFAVFEAMPEIFPDIAPRHVDDPRLLGAPDLIILPGTRNTLEDLAFLRESGLADALLARRAEGAAIIGIGGGFQMLGKRVRGPEGGKSAKGELPGLGLLDMDTLCTEKKRTVRMRGRIGAAAAATPLLRGAAGMEVAGHEVHMGESQSLACPPLGLDAPGGAFGALSGDGLVFGSYVHGFFDNTALSRLLLNNLRQRKGLDPLNPPAAADENFRQAEYGRLADMVEANLDMPALEAVIWEGEGGR